MGENELYGWTLTTWMELNGIELNWIEFQPMISSKVFF